MTRTYICRKCHSWNEENPCTLSTPAADVPPTACPWDGADTFVGIEPDWVEEIPEPEIPEPSEIIVGS
jgi:hypothetical protein